MLLVLYQLPLFTQPQTQGMMQQFMSWPHDRFVIETGKNRDFATIAHSAAQKPPPEFAGTSTAPHHCSLHQCSFAVMMANQPVTYTELHATEVSDDQLTSHAHLFSNHYGVWGKNPQGLTEGARVRSTAKKLRRDHLFDEQRCSLIKATVMVEGSDQLVGHAFVYRYDIPGKGKVSWVTQLVVHEDYRHQGIATKLCRMAWVVDDYYAAGLVSSHPHAVRSLERATERTCDRATSMQAAQEIVAHAAIPYVQGAGLHFEDNRCLIDTQYFVDHTHVNQILLGLSQWDLGHLEEGMEFFAFTFAAQPTVPRTPSPTYVYQVIDYELYTQGLFTTLDAAREAVRDLYASRPMLNDDQEQMYQINRIPLNTLGDYGEGFDVVE